MPRIIGGINPIIPSATRYPSRAERMLFAPAVSLHGALLNFQVERGGWFVVSRCRVPCDQRSGRIVPRARWWTIVPEHWRSPEIIVIESELRNNAHESLKNRCRVIPVAKPGSLLWQRRAALAWLHASLADKSAGSSVQLPCYLVIPLVICTWCFDSIYSLSLPLSLSLNGITIIHPPWIAPTLTCLNNLSTFYISHFYKFWLWGKSSYCYAIIRIILFYYKLLF